MARSLAFVCWSYRLSIGFAKNATFDKCCKEHIIAIKSHSQQEGWE
jgi:hypothetical protein